MIALNQFNSLCEDEAARLLAPCVAIPAWSEMLVSLRPFASRHALLQAARLLAPCVAPVRRYNQRRTS